MSSPKHIFSLDYLRGIAAILVSLFHFTDKADYLLNTNILKQIFSYGHYGVEIFFIISGVVIPYSMDRGRYHIRDFFIFFKKRLIRIEPPYLICVVLALFLNYLTTLSPVYNGPPFKIDYIQLFAHLGYLNTFIGKDWLNPVFWTLAIEFQYYILIALMFPLVSSTKWYLYIPFFILFNSFGNYFGREFIFHFSIYFSIGIIIYRYFVNKTTILELVFLIILALGWIYLQFGLTEVIVTILTCIFILIPLNANKIGIFLGNISYSLYLLHFIIGLRIINLTQRFAQEEAIRMLMVFLALFISLISAYIYYKLVELPFKKLAGRISYSNNKETKISPVSS